MDHGPTGATFAHGIDRVWHVWPRQQAELKKFLQINGCTDVNRPQRKPGKDSLCENHVHSNTPIPINPIISIHFYWFILRLLERLRETSSGCSCSMTPQETLYPVHLAAHLGDADLLRLVLQAGADATQQSSMGRSAWDVAVQSNVYGSHDEAHQNTPWTTDISLSCGRTGTLV